MKKISAIVAAIATMLLSVFAFAPSAMAADYSATITPGTTEGAATITVTVDAATAEAYPFIAVQYDDAEVTSVVPAAIKTTQWYEVATTFTKQANGDYTKLFKVTTLNCKDATITVLGAKDANGTGETTLETKKVSFANTCPTSGSNAAAGTGSNGATVAKTGASIMPYGIAVLLMVAAGVAMFAVRKTNAR
ncbi:hypothetical protein [Bifidobacterium parmae]|uniref:Uncharacterized protein n=1 Tax=Bifidobacterium parmae TaxID=361854 RepID=A0A2N5J0H2_9BIFI|nr:hypothetical protein [Bifidobacterium parmae]PLS27691.1 hypothetical protein Uis4E_1377 [Bifidobacterium parmae]